MEFAIQYKVKTAYGFWKERSYVVFSKKEYNEILKIIKREPDNYRLVSVTFH